MEMKVNQETILLNYGNVIGEKDKDFAVTL